MLHPPAAYQPSFSEHAHNYDSPKASTNKGGAGDASSRSGVPPGSLWHQTPGGFPGGGGSGSGGVRGGFDGGGFDPSWRTRSSFDTASPAHPLPPPHPLRQSAPGHPPAIMMGREGGWGGGDRRGGGEGHGRVRAPSPTPDRSNGPFSRALSPSPSRIMPSSSAVPLYPHQQFRGHGSAGMMQGQSGGDSNIVFM